MITIHKMWERAKSKGKNNKLHRAKASKIVMSISILALCMGLLTGHAWRSLQGN